jgi:7-carboxy-7-deazaguanine synthase
MCRLSGLPPSEKGVRRISFHKKQGLKMILSDHDFPVSEIFTSIQGEGNYAGVNSLFIRFQLCNLTCSWCDTKYTWTRFSDKFALHKTGELVEIIEKAPQKHIIFTGGEPDLYRLDLLSVNHSKKFHVESNGTIIPVQPLDIELRDGVKIQRGAMDEKIIKNFNWVISPKLSNSKQAIVPESIRFWSQKEYAVFKFIAGSVSDIDETEEFIAKYNIPVPKVYIGLLGTNTESQLRPDLVDEIINRGFHFSPRLHTLLWGQKRGK